MSKRIALILIIMVVLSIVGCDNAGFQKKKIEGTWQSENEKYVFAKDGTFRYYHWATVDLGTYRIEKKKGDDNLIYLSSGGNEETVWFHFNDDRIVIGTREYNKIRESEESAKIRLTNKTTYNASYSSGYSNPDSFNKITFWQNHHFFSDFVVNRDFGDSVYDEHYSINNGIVHVDACGGPYYDNKGNKDLSFDFYLEDFDNYIVVYTDNLESGTVLFIEERYEDLTDELLKENERIAADYRRIIDQEPTYNFCLYDIDNNGVKELWIIREDYEDSARDIACAFSWDGESAYQLEWDVTEPKGMVMPDGTNYAGSPTLYEIGVDGNFYVAYFYAGPSKISMIDGKIINDYNPIEPIASLIDYKALSMYYADSPYGLEKIISSDFSIEGIKSFHKTVHEDSSSEASIENNAQNSFSGSEMSNEKEELGKSTMDTASSEILSEKSYAREFYLHYCDVYPNDIFWNVEDDSVTVTSYDEKSIKWHPSEFGADAEWNNFHGVLTQKIDEIHKEDAYVYSINDGGKEEFLDYFPDKGFLRFSYDTSLGTVKKYYANPEGTEYLESVFGKSNSNYEEEFENTIHYYDEANLVSENGSLEIKNKLNALQKDFHTDFIVYTVEDANTALSAEEYCDQLYYTKGFGIGDDRNGSMLFINIGTREVMIYAQAKEMRYFTDKAIEQILYSYNGGIMSNFAAGDFGGGVIKYLESVRDLYEQGVSPDQYNSLPIEMLNEKTFEYICNINDMGLWESSLIVEPIFISNANREKIYINGEEFTLEEVNTIPLYLTGINVEQYSFSRVTNTVYEGYKQYVYVYPEYFTIAYLCEEEGYKYFSYDGKGMELITAHKEYIDSLNHNT